MKRKRKLKKKFVVFLSLYALFFVSYFTLTTLAKFTTVLNGKGQALVAKWDVSIAGEDNKKLPTMFIGHSNTYQSYELSVTSRSEVAIRYSAVISNVPDGVQIKVDDNERLYSGNTITIELGTLNAVDLTTMDEQTHKHKFTILVPSDTGIVPFEDHALNIDVIFTQVEIG